MKKLFFFILTAFLLVGVNSVWGETITLTVGGLGLSGSYTSSSKTIDGITFEWAELMKSSSSIQAKATTGTLYNTTAFPGNITSVQIQHTGTARSTTIHYSTDGSTWEAAGDSFSGSRTVDLSSYKCKYFKITRGSNAAYWESIVITYEAAAPAEERTITWSVNGVETTTKVNDYEQPLPAAEPTTSDCDESKVFVGWTTSAIVGTTDIAPAELYVTAELPEVSADVTYYAVFATETVEEGIVTEDFSSSSSTNANWTTELGSYTSVPKFKLEADGYIQSPILGPITEVSFLYKGNNVSGGSYLAFSVSTDGSVFTEIEAERLTNPTTQSTKKITLDANDGYKAFKLQYIKVAGNLALDNIVVKYEGEVTTYSAYATDCSTGSCTDAEASVVDGEATLNIEFDLSDLLTSKNTNTPVFTCTSENNASCIIEGSSFTATAAGDYTIQVTQEFDDLYCAVNETFTVSVPQIVLAAPTNLTNTTPEAKTVTLSWDVVANASKYEVTLDPTSASVQTWINYTEGTCEVSGLTPETEYTWSVKAIGEGNYINSAQSESVSFSTRALYDYTIIWSNNGEAYTEGAPSATAQEDSQVDALPTEPTAPEYASTKTFMGWTATPIADAQATAPTDLFTDVENSPVITQNTTFYAVFADITITGEGNITEMAEGTYYISHTKENVTYYLKGNGTSSAPVSVTDKAQATAFDAVKEGDNYIFYVSGSRNEWLYSIKDNNGIRIGDNTDNTWAVSEGTLTSGQFDLKHIATGRFLTLYNTQDFRAYTSASASNRTENTDLEYAPLASNYATSIKKDATALDNATLNNTDVHKVIENGQVIIIRDGVRYNILGTVVE